jgi:energy-coupling factor transporter transmembrane protein EcfT
MSAGARLEPRAAGPLLLGSLVGSLVAGRFETVSICVATAVLGSVLAHAAWPSRRVVRTAVIGILIAIGLNVLLVHGRPLLPLPWPWSGTREGLAAGTLLALRLCGATAAVHGLRYAWPGERAADELAGRIGFLERLRVPVRAARAVVGLALRFAPLVADEAARIVALQDHRAGGAPRSRSQWLERRRALVVPLLVCTLERAERVALGMEARHYRVRPLAPVRRSWAGEACGVGLAAMAIVWRG